MTILAVLFDCIIGYILAAKVKSKLKLTALLIPAGLLVSVIVVAVSAVLSGQLTAEHAVYIAGYTLPNALLIGIICWASRRRVNPQSEGTADR